MALLSIIVRQAQYSGDRSVTSQYCTYVTLTLDRCRTTTVTVKGHNPHWEQDYLFETQNTSRGLLIEVWKQDDYLHTPIGCYWLPLNMVRYSNEHTTGLWASLGSELFIENGLIVKSVNSTGHFLLYDARLEDPDDRRVEHANVDNENVEDYYQSTTSRRVNESSSNKVAPPALPAEPNGEWYRYENYQDGYRSSSSENVRSDLDYSYSETSNHIDRRSCYESSEKSLEKEQYSHEERNEQSYYSEYDQSENYKSTNSFSKRSNYENQVDGDEQWVSDEYADEQGDEIYQNSHHDYGPSDGEYNFSYKSSHFKRTENNSKMCYNQDGLGDGGSYEDDELEEDEVDEEEDEPDDGQYYENNSYVYVQSPPTTKRILPSIPSFDGGGVAKKAPNYRKNNYYFDQYKDKNHIGEYPPRVPSIYVDSPTLSPCLSASKSTSFDYRDHNSDDSASIYHFSDNSTTAHCNEKTYNHGKTSTIHRYNRRDETNDHNFSRINDGYASNEDEAEDYGDYVNDESAYPSDYYDYDDYAKNEDEQRSNDDDINNNQLVNHRSSIRDYAKKLCSPFTKEPTPPSVPETFETNRRDAFSNRAKSSSLTRQSSNFPEQFEWTFNELPEEEYDHFEQPGPTALTNRASLPEIEPIGPPAAITSYNKSQLTSFYNPIDSILEEDYNEEEDDVTLVSPVNSSSLSPRSMNYLSQEKDHDTQETYDKDNSLESYHEDLGKQSPISETDHFNDSSMADHTVDSYHSSYAPPKTSIDETHSLQNDNNSMDNENQRNSFSMMDQLEVVQPEPRKSSLQKEENTAEMRRMRARNRWHTAYNKIVHQLNVSIIEGRFL